MRLLTYICLLASPFLTACSGSDAALPMTYEAKRIAYRDVIRGCGTRDAKSSKSLNMPRLRMSPPEIAYLIPEGTQVEKGEVVVRFDTDQVERNFISAENEVALASAQVEQRRAELQLQRRELEASVKTGSAKEDVSRLQSEKLKFVAPRVREMETLKMKKASLNASKARERLETLGEVEASELGALQAKVKQAEIKLETAKRNMEMLTLTAPSAGVAVYERNRRTREPVKVGDQLWLGMRVVKLPDLSAMQVKLEVDEIRAQRVKAKQPVAIRIPSLESTSFRGAVTRVGKRARPVKRGSKVKQVEVVVDIDGVARGLVPGLTADVEVTVDTADTAFSVDIDCVFPRDSSQVVFAQKDSRFRPPPAEVVNKGENFFVVTGDLEDGVRLALTEPDDQSID